MQKKGRMLKIFYRLMKGENVSVKETAEEYGVSPKSISRDIGEIKNFLSNARELVGYSEICYAADSKTYYMEFDSFLLNKELTAVTKVLLGSRAFSKMEVLEMISKLKCFTTYHDRKMLDQLIANEMYQYNEVKHDCKSVIDNIWKLTGCIHDKKEITIGYYKQDRRMVNRRIMPIAIIFSEYYFYLIAYRCDKEEKIPLYYRVDRVVHIVEHRTHFELEERYLFDEGDLRNKIHFMQSGECRRIKFSYSGPSVQAILDKIPTAKVIDIKGDEKIITAETYGKGINMFLLSQGSMVQVLEPEGLVEEMAEEIGRMAARYPAVG